METSLDMDQRWDLFDSAKSSRSGIVHVVYALVFYIQEFVNFDCPLEVDWQRKSHSNFAP